MKLSDTLVFRWLNSSLPRIFTKSIHKHTDTNKSAYKIKVPAFYMFSPFNYT